MEPGKSMKNWDGIYEDMGLIIQISENFTWMQPEIRISKGFDIPPAGMWRSTLMELLRDRILLYSPYLDSSGIHVDNGFKIQDERFIKNIH